MIVNKNVKKEAANYQKEVIMNFQKKDHYLKLLNILKIQAKIYILLVRMVIIKKDIVVYKIEEKKDYVM
jgi:hypothetical protein